MPLVAVMIGRDNKCYQFMPLMTDDLSAVVRRVGCLETLSKEKDPDAWRTVLANSLHLLESIILGLQYLEAHNMQHSDVKCTF